MAITEVGIVNSALVKIGADTISSLSEDKKSARLANTIFQTARDEVMASHPWNFAVKRITLYPNSTTPDSEYAYTYDLPADVLRVIDSYTDDVEYTVEANRTILSDDTTVSIKYIYKNTDTSTWTPLFAEVLAWRLARDLSYALTQSVTLRQEMDKGYRVAIAEARSLDGMEGGLIKFSADEWTRARR
jgi:hypothetical protein